MTFWFIIFPKNRCNLVECLIGGFDVINNKIWKYE